MVDTGCLECIVGGMFSGKSEELIRRLRRCVLAKQKVVGIKPTVDDRYDLGHISSHNGVQFAAVYLSDPASILTLPDIQDASVVGIDEAQFFDDSIIDVCNALASRGKRVIVSGLDMDYRGKPFGPMPQLMAVADSVLKVNAVCTICGSAATRSQRIVNSTALVMTGGAESYEARCRKHWYPESSI